MTCTLIHTLQKHLLWYVCLYCKNYFFNNYTAKVRFSAIHTSLTITSNHSALTFQYQLFHCGWQFFIFVFKKKSFFPLNFCHYEDSKCLDYLCNSYMLWSVENPRLFPPCQGGGVIQGVSCSTSPPFSSLRSDWGKCMQARGRERKIKVRELTSRR